MPYFCCENRRREAVRNFPDLNGIDFLEVLDSEAPNPAERQRLLRLHFLKAPAPPDLGLANVQFSGGERIRKVQAQAVSYDGDVVVVQVNAPGDFSTYTLRLVQTDAKGMPLDQPFPHLDPLLASVDFSFKVECPSDFDCQPERLCPTAPLVTPEINYLAKDYASFCQLLLDRLALLLPQWRERHSADLGVTLVELLAYVADYFSYQQDAVAAEAYLGTARRRVSVRRHARLVDYFMHEGGNARVWVQVEVNADNVLLLKSTPLLTHAEGQAVVIPPGSAAYSQALSLNPEVFETVAEARLFQAHNELPFYTWGASQCCLPQRATSATLQGHYPNLQVNDVLIFEEVLGPQTGNKDDANPDRRHAVHLIRVQPSSDRLGGQFLAPPKANSVDVTEIEWAADDALPFPFCLSAEIEVSGVKQDIAAISVARGNIVLADHGLTVANEALGEVPQPHLFRVPPPNPNRCQERALEPTPSRFHPRPIPPRFRPRLNQAPLTFAVPYNNVASPPSASATLHPPPAQALPAIVELQSTPESKTPWIPQRDLLGSAPDATEFVVETESDGATYLRFGDNEHGLRPDPGTRFTVSYRVGNGVSGNVGAETIRHIVSPEAAVQSVRNPLPAQGGVEPESLEDVRQKAPFALRTQERAVTPDDYAALAGRTPGVQQAAATFRWTGSWRTVFIALDRFGGTPVNDSFKQDLRRDLEQFRLVGHDVEIEEPRYISLEIELRVCVRPEHFRSNVKAALLQVFSNRLLPDGRRGVFHPDNFTFGQPVYLSPLYAAAQAVEGVASVQVTTFQRQGRPSFEALDKGRLELGRIEIARLDNDPNFPEHGVFRLSLEGGK